MKATATTDTTLRIERVIDAAQEAVYRAWTTREAMEQWYQDQPGWIVDVSELDVRVGGAYRVAWGPAGEPPYVETGTYLELNPPRRIVMTETLATGDGQIMWDTRVTVELHAENGKTRLTLFQEDFPSSEVRDQAAGGWPHFLDRLERLVTS